MGASASTSTSGLSGSQFKKASGEREIAERAQVQSSEEERSDVALRDHAAGRICSKYPEREPEEVARLAESISNSNSLQQAFFSGISEASVENLPLAIIWRDIVCTDTRKKLEQAFDKFAPQFQYGPYCATVKIGDMYLTWDNSDLVIPQAEMSYIFAEVPTHDVDTPTGVSLGSALSPEDVTISPTFKEEFLVDMGHNKTEKIKAVMDVLVRYNTKYHYGLLTCNCQHFVCDILEALDAKEHARGFEDCLSHHSRVLEVRGLNVVKEEFNSHEELDTYVNIRLESMDAGEIYFCYGHYLLFHAWSEECPQLSAFKCPVNSCRFRELKYRI